MLEFYIIFRNYSQLFKTVFSPISILDKQKWKRRKKLPPQIRAAPRLTLPVSTSQCNARPGLTFRILLLSGVQHLIRPHGCLLTAFFGSNAASFLYASIIFFLLLLKVWKVFNIHNGWLQLVQCLFRGSCFDVQVLALGSRHTRKLCKSPQC